MEVRNIASVLCKIVELRGVVDSILDTDCVEDRLMIELDTVCSELEDIIN